MMNENEDNFGWARQLECPESSIPDTVKKLLHQGISSLLWEELACSLHPAEKVLNVRKNILLYKLKHKEKEASFQNARSAAKIKVARSLLDPEIENLEEKCKEQDCRARQKYQLLSRIKSQRRYLKIKEDLLKMKLNDLKNQVADCREMRSVCQYLMPAGNCRIDHDVVTESLQLVSGISTRADRRMALNKIAENFESIEISTLWNMLLSRRTRDTEELMELGTREMNDERLKSGKTKDISIGIARGRYIATAIQDQICCVKNSELEKQVVEYIEKIEASESNNAYVSEWLALSLEVRKLETEQNCLEMEINNLKKLLEQEFSLSDELSNLESDMHSIHTKMENCMQDIQKSLMLLSPAGSEISGTRNKLLGVLHKIAALREEKQNTDYLNIDPSMELNTFHDAIQLEALRKIMLKDNVGAYRHTKFCINEAFQATTDSQQMNIASQFPMVRGPVYQLLHCYKELVTASWLAKLENQSSTNERYELEEWTSPRIEKSSDDTIEILNVTDSTCDRVLEEINGLDSIFDAWKYQTVKKVMRLDDRIVKGASFQEWLKRYEIMLHMIRQKK